MECIQFDEVKIHVTRKDIHALRMRICPPHAEVRVSVPLHATPTELLRFIRGRAAWIRHHRERILARYAHAIPPCHAESGDTVHIWGEPHRLELREAARAGIGCESALLMLDMLPGSSREQRLRVLRNGCRRILRDAAIVLVVGWAAQMGVCVPEVRIRSMKTRWGTCNPRARRIWLSAELVRHVPAALEYVVVHELAHLIERTHGPLFERVLDRALPDWRVRKQLLNASSLHPEAWL